MDDFAKKQLQLKFFYYTAVHPNGESFKRCQVTMWGCTGLLRLNGLSLMTGPDEVVKTFGKLGSEYAFVIESEKEGDRFVADGSVYLAWKGGKLFQLDELNGGHAESFGSE